MGARRSSTVILAVGVCFLAAVAAAANVQPLDIEWKVGLTETYLATYQQHLFLVVLYSSQVQQYVRVICHPHQR